MTGMKESGDTVVNVMLPETSSSMTGFEVMVLGCISLECLTDHHGIANSTLTAVWYHYDILRECGFGVAVGPELLLLQSV